MVVSDGWVKYWEMGMVEEERVISTVGLGGHHDVMGTSVRVWVREVIRKLLHLLHHHVH